MRDDRKTVEHSPRREDETAAHAGGAGGTHVPSVPGYELLSELGRGGMGVVYLARQVSLNRRVALKMIRSGELASKEERERFLAEASAIARLQHPGIVQVHEVGTFGDCPYFALEYVEGGSLAAYLAGEPQPPRPAAHVVAQLARAMQHAHERGVIHRDLKPANVLLHGEPTADRARPFPETESPQPPQPPSSNTGKLSGGSSSSLRERETKLPTFQPKITDFGIAKLTDVEGGGTVSGAILGTPAYASPEQAAGQARSAGPAADIHALGILLYEMLTGRPPFKGATPLQTLELIRTQEAVPPRSLQPGVPRDLDIITLKCLQKSPTRRYSTAAELADDLERFLKGEPIQARPVGIVERAAKWARRRPTAAALVVVTVLALIVGGIGVWRYQQDLGEALTQARDEKDEADRAKRVVEERERELIEKNAEVDREFRKARRSLYTLQLTQAESLIHRDPGRARILLDDPEKCPEDLRDFTWGWFHRLSSREVRRFRAHEQSINGTAMTSDGRTTITASADRSVKLWDTATGQPRGSLPGIKAGVSSLALSPDGKTVAAGCANGEILLWNLADRTLKHALAVGGSHIVSVAFSPDGKQLASGGVDVPVIVWDTTTGAKRSTHAGNVSPPCVVAWSPRGDRLAVGTCQPHLTLLIDLAQGKQTLLHRHERQVVAVAFSADAGLLAAHESPPLMDGSAAVKLWDMSAAAPRSIASFSSPSGLFGNLLFLPDRPILLTPGFEKTVRLYDTLRREEMLILREHPARVESVAFNVEMQLLAAGCHDGSLVLHDLRADRGEPPLYEGEARHIAASFSPDGEELIVVGYRPVVGQAPQVEVRHFDWKTRRETIADWGVGMALDVVHSPDGKLRVLGIETSVHIEDRQTGLRRKLADRGPLTRKVLLSPDGRYVVAAREAGRLTRWDLTTGESRTLLEGIEAGGLFGLNVLNDGRTLVVGGGRNDGPGIVTAVDLLDGRTLTTFKAHEQRIARTALSPDGTTLATASWDRTVKLWNVEDWTLRTTLRGHTDRVMSLAFSKDGRTLATGGQDRTIKLWDPVRGEHRATLQGHAGWVQGMAFHPSGKALVSVGSEGAVRVWRAD